MKTGTLQRGRACKTELRGETNMKKDKPRNYTFILFFKDGKVQFRPYRISKARFPNGVAYCKKVTINTLADYQKINKIISELTEQGLVGRG